MDGERGREREEVGEREERSTIERDGEREREKHHGDEREEIVEMSTTGDPHFSLLPWSIYIYTSLPPPPPPSPPPRPHTLASTLLLPASSSIHPPSVPWLSMFRT